MKLTPQTFITADTHFYHDAIIHLGHRPTDFNERIIENWNKVVGKHDKVLHLGDLILDNKEKAMELGKRLRGEKYLIIGNHDGHSDSWYRDCGFTVVEPIYKQFKDKYDRRINVLFTHEPVIPLPYLAMEPPIEDVVQGLWFNIHGHIHSSIPHCFAGENHRGIATTNHHYDVGVDAHNFELVPLYTILDYFFSTI